MSSPDDLPASPPAAPFATVRHLPPPPAGWGIERYAVLADGNLAILARAAGGATRILTLGLDAWIDGPDVPMPTWLASFDRFPDGRWLVAEIRTDGEAHAHILAPEGAALGRITLGDGLEHVAVDDAGRIWAGWFDEGVLGNRNWRVPGLQWPPSRYGVGCFTDDGAPVPLPSWWDHAGHVVDCYALNSAGPGVWICYYTDFPLVRLVPGKPVRWWRTELSGARAVAVAGPRALVAGGYGGDADRLVLIDLPGDGSGAYVTTATAWSLPLRPARSPRYEGHVWQAPTLLRGRGDTLHLVDDDVWFRWRVSDLPV